MAKEREGKRIERFNWDDKITYKKISDAMKKVCDPAVERIDILSDGWIFEMDYQGFGSTTSFFCTHKPGFLVLMTPIYPRFQENIDNGQKIKKIIDKTVGYMPCCQFKNPSIDFKDKFQAYVYSDSWSDDECFNSFMTLVENGNKQIVNLERLKSEKPVLS